MTTSAAVSFVDALKSRYGAVDETEYAADAFLVGDASKKRNKQWEMVGMEKTRLKQAQHSKLVTVVLRECGITVAQHHDTEITEQQLVRVQELDVSGNVNLTVLDLNTFVSHLPMLHHLQASDIPVFRSPLQAPLDWSKLKKLVLNNTGFVELGQIAVLLHVPALDELHLDFNNISTLLGKGAAALETTWSMPSVVALSLGGNQFTSWKDSALGVALPRYFPSLRRLFLTNNPLPDLTEDDDASVAPFLQSLTLLCLNDNKNIQSPKTVERLRALAPKLDTFRITYQTLYPKLNESLARMMVIATLPGITTLNRAQVRPKERTDSELFYVQRGLSETNEQLRQEQYPFTQVLREKHKDVVLALLKEGETASSGAHIMLDLRFRCDGFEDVRKTVPSSLQIGKLKALIRTVFGIDVNYQVLGYWSEDAAVVTAATPLDNELQSLGHFGVGNGAIIRVQDTSLRR